MGVGDGFEARLLLREARQGVLATAAGGEPQAGWVTPATDAGLQILLLLSGLSAHTKALEASPSCALLVTGRPAGANPQLTPRISVNGHAEKLARSSPDYHASRARYLAVHPYAALYADFEDFSLWRITPRSALHVAGFGRARKLGPASLCPSAAIVAAIDEDRGSLMPFAAGLRDHVVGLDCDGVDVQHDEATERWSFSAPAVSPDEWREAFEQLVM